MINRILIAGFGSIGQRHLRIVRAAHPDADIRVLRREVDGQVIPLANGIFVDVDEALAFSPNCAVIANPAPFHIPLAKALMSAGCHVLIEKPLAEASAEIPECIEIAKKSGVKMQVGYNLRFQPSLQEFRRLVQVGYVGKIFSVRCEAGQYLPTWRPGTNFHQGVSAREELGGGVLLELSHELDYLRWIFGNVLWVNAWTGRMSGLGLGVEDTAHLIMEMESNNSSVVCALNIDFARHDSTRQCVAVGTNGTLRWNGISGDVEHFSQENKEWKTVYSHKSDRDECYIDQWKDFIRSIMDGSQPKISGADGLAVVRIVEAAKASSTNSGQKTTLTY